jgi:hypothetical protein
MIRCEYRARSLIAQIAQERLRRGAGLRGIPDWQERPGRHRAVSDLWRAGRRCGCALGPWPGGHAMTNVGHAYGSLGRAILRGGWSA